MNKPRQIDQQFRNEPIYWFSILELAVHRGQHDVAANAQRQLANLGVQVNYGRPVKLEAAAHAR